MGGENWNKEVQVSQMESGSAGLKRYETRVNFYKDRVKNKLGETFDDIVKDKLLKGYKTFEEHDGKNLVHEVKAGDTLFVILKDFYKTQFNLDTTQAEKEAYLSLAYVTKDKSASTDILVNMDALELGWSVIIDSGVITVRDAGGTTPSGVDRMDLRPRHLVDRSPVAPDTTRTAGVTSLGRVQGEVMNQAVPPVATALTGTAEGERIFVDLEEAHITKLKEDLKAYEGQYELFENGTIINVKSPLNPQLSARWNNEAKGWIVEGSDIKYDRPQEAFADLLLINEAVKIWTHNMSNATPGEDPFYLITSYTGDPDVSIRGEMSGSLKYQSDWLDETIAFNPFADKEKLLAHINTLYKENVTAKEIQTSEPRPEESENGMKARDVIRDTLKGIHLDFIFTILNSTELQIQRMGTEPVLVKWNEADKEWTFTYKETTYSDSDLDYMVKQVYKLQVSELKQ